MMWIQQFIRNLNKEALIWIIGLLYLACINPYSETHFSFCLFRFLGIKSCPGCGLGHSISYLLRGDVLSSLRAHPLGGIAVLILGSRICSLVKMAYRKSVISTPVA